MKQPQPALAADVPAEQLYDGLSALPEKYRVPLILHYLEGFTQEEVANLLGMRASAVGVRLMRGRQKLCECLKRKGMATSVAALGLALAAETTVHAPAAMAAAMGKMVAAGMAQAAGIGTVSAQAAALSQGMVRLLVLAKIKLAILATMTALVVLAGFAGLTYIAWPKMPADIATRMNAPSPVATTAIETLPTYDFQRMESGQLLHATLTTLISFDGDNTGATPIGSELVADAAGNLYGTTSASGPRGCGTAFKIGPDASFTTLAVFNLANGSSPQGALLADATGNFYGTTYQGGELTLNKHYGYGTAFKIAASTNQVIKLVTFNFANGANPDGALVADRAGNLYGTTKFGGHQTVPGCPGCGTVFKIAAGTNTLTTLAKFDGTNGYYPQGGLIIDSDGNLYGTTYGDDANGSTVFKIFAGTNTLTTLATFNSDKGTNPNGRLAIDAAGNLFGTTYAYYNGTDMGGEGTVFEVAVGSNRITTLARFDGSNGEHPEAGVIVDAAGNLYGTTRWRGPQGHGTIFKILASSNTIITLASFNGENGELPRAGLFADTAGNLYGTTSSGGEYDCGTVFKLSGSGYVTATK